MIPGIGTSIRHLSYDQTALKEQSIKANFIGNTERLNKFRTVTLMLENIVPNNKNNNLGSIDRMSFCENMTQTVVIINIATNGIIGRIASINGLIFPVRFLYDLKI